MTARRPDPGRAYTFFADGIAAPQGSKRLVRTRSGRTIMLENSRRVAPWRVTVAAAAQAAGVPLFDGDVIVHITTRFVRPSSHFGKTGLRATAPARPGYADCDKLARAVCDALAGVAYRNDRQVCGLCVDRVWCNDGERPGATITIVNAPAQGIWTYST